MELKPSVLRTGLIEEETAETMLALLAVIVMTELFARPIIETRTASVASIALSDGTGISTGEVGSVPVDKTTPFSDKVVVPLANAV